MFVIVMGVSGCGKSTVGALLAKRLGLVFQDADAFHPRENRAKMATDTPLADVDRWPWLELLGRLAGGWDARGGAVLACSALKQAYRDSLVQRVLRPRIVYLELPRASAQRRLEARRGQHEFVRDFGRILDGQYRHLEPPVGTDVVTISAELNPAEIVEKVVARLLPQRAPGGRPARSGPMAH
jgi:carbohydrate kinase (thermoresistant glucokinase family)